MTHSHNFDVVVVGGGIAGLAAAGRAAELGLQVALLERGTGDRYPCNSRWSGGILHVAFRSVKAPAAELLESIQDATRGSADPALALALAQTSGRAADWLGQQGAKYIKTAQVEWQHHVLAPPRRIMAGHDWEGRGPDFTLRTLANNLQTRGGAVFGGTEATALMESGGACIGVEARDAQGDVHQFGAGAVVLADGGFQANLELVGRAISSAPAKLMQRGAATGRGDGLRMAQALGAEIRDLDHFYGHLLSRDALTNDKVWPYPQLDELGMAGIVVDGDGRRFADEGRGGVHLANAVAKLPDPLSAWAIFDEDVWQGPGRAARIPVNPHYVTAGGTLLKAASIEELARLAGLPADALQATVDAYRHAAAANATQDLAPARSVGAERKAWPLARGPFYATPLCAGITYTLGGIATGACGEVLRAGGAPIPGLYAAGATTAGLEGRSGATYIGGLMKSLVFGLRAAEHATQLLRARGR